jgi:hypothetical protein
MIKHKNKFYVCNILSATLTFYSKAQKYSFRMILGIIIVLSEIMLSHQAQGQAIPAPMNQQSLPHSKIAAVRVGDDQTAIAINHITNIIYVGCNKKGILFICSIG